MIIKGTRLRRLPKPLRSGFLGIEISIVSPVLESNKEKLVLTGFSSDLSAGEQVLPSASIGPVCRFNALGREIVHRDQPQETRSRLVEWHWTQWRGRYDSEEQSKLVDVPYKRFPRSMVPPAGIELSILNVDGTTCIVAPTVKNTPDNYDVLLLTINLLLEVTGECHLRRIESDNVLPIQIKRLNWKVLPPGRYPWPALRKHLNETFNSSPKGNWPVIDARLQHINEYAPEFVAVGHAGFNGYLVFGFPSRQLFFLESVHLDNATYVFNESWEELSKKTKAEVLAETLQLARIVHTTEWFSKITRLFASVKVSNL